MRLLLKLCSLAFLALTSPLANAIIYSCPPSDKVLVIQPVIDQIQSYTGPRPFTVWASTTGGNWVNTRATGEVGKLSSMSVISEGTAMRVIVNCNYKGTGDFASYKRNTTDGQLEMYLNSSNCSRMPKVVQDQPCGGADSCKIDCGGPLSSTPSKVKSLGSTRSKVEQLVAE